MEERRSKMIDIQEDELEGVLEADISGALGVDAFIEGSINFIGESSIENEEIEDASTPNALNIVLTLFMVILVVLLAGVLGIAGIYLFMM